MLYESHLVGFFNYYWGYEDKKNKKAFNALILSNAQNSFDALFGDVIAATGERYFLIEFKKERNAFAKEIRGSKPKPARQEFYKLMKEHSSSTCAQASQFAHFGAYADDKNKILFESYFSAVATQKTKETLIKEVFSSDYVHHSIDYANKPCDIDGFYEYMNCPSREIVGFSKNLYGDGMGVPKDTFVQYLQCMLNTITAQQPLNGGTLILGRTSPTSGANLVFTSFNSLKKLLEVNMKNSTAVATKPKQDSCGRT